ncbi:MAG: hypothetical protein HY717_06010 [Planctomycetes bacterium]|nr:hypothetical protein [Planctomycetota bacterium]
MRSAFSTWLAGFFIVAVWSSDAALLVFWQKALPFLGPVLGFELGILLFMNLLAGLLLLDLLEPRFRMPGLGWFYNLPARAGRARRREASRPSSFRWPNLGWRGVQFLLLTLLFYLLETFLLPFFPHPRGLQQEVVLLAGGLILWRALKPHG